jgi:hypothetical protein
MQTKSKQNTCSSFGLKRILFLMCLYRVCTHKTVSDASIKECADNNFTTRTVSDFQAPLDKKGVKSQKKKKKIFNCTTQTVFGSSGSLLPVQDLFPTLFLLRLSIKIYTSRQRFKIQTSIIDNTRIAASFGRHLKPPKECTNKVKVLCHQIQFFFFRYQM